MDKQDAVTINGVAYDTHTGLRISPSQSVKSSRVSSPSAGQIHKTTDRTHTLSRSHVKVPAKHTAVAHKQAATKSPMISKFADIRSSQSVKPLVNTVKKPDIAPTRHPIQTHAAKRVAHTYTSSHPIKTQAAQPKPAHEIKHKAIERAMKKAKPAKKERTPFFSRHPRALSIASASLALVLLAGYFTYINLPSLSVRIAAAQAGIAATYPSYHPSGYSLHGPVAYSNGQVSMKFAANVGPQSFTVNQASSNWDSSALLNDYVQNASNGDYQTYSDSGLTIYVYGSSAAWVNGGVLHTISGQAPLTSDQIRNIATSM